MCLHLGNICDGYKDCPFVNNELIVYMPVYVYCMLLIVEDT